MILYAPLFSHESGESPESVFTGPDAAINWMDRVLDAQPGIEAVLMVHRNREEGWRSLSGGETVLQVRAARWQDPT